MAPTVTCLEVDRASMAHPGGDVAAHASPDTVTRRVTAGSSPLLSSRAMSFASRTAATVASAIAARSSVAVATSTVTGAWSSARLGAGVVGVAAAAAPGFCLSHRRCRYIALGSDHSRKRTKDRKPQTPPWRSTIVGLALRTLLTAMTFFAAPLNLLNRADAFMSASTSSLAPRCNVERRARDF